MHTIVFWDVTPCSLVNVLFHLQDRWVGWSSTYFYSTYVWYSQIVFRFHSFSFPSYLYLTVFHCFLFSFFLSLFRFFFTPRDYLMFILSVVSCLSIPSPLYLSYIVICFLIFPFCLSNFCYLSLFVSFLCFLSNNFLVFPLSFALYFFISQCIPFSFTFSAYLSSTFLHTIFPSVFSSFHRLHS
jgi:hypothetical protein